MKNIPYQTQMFIEAAEAAVVVDRQLEYNEIAIADCARAIAAFNPNHIFTCARGSSDHASLFGKYLFEIQCGIPVSSFSPSIASIYDYPFNFTGSVFIAISQSGKSPDLLQSAEKAKSGGALVIALVNDEDSPLARLASHVIALKAGPEKSVAATKSFIASLSALAHLIFHLTQDKTRLTSLRALPKKLEEAWSHDWTAATLKLKTANNMFVVGRGIGLGVAAEAALKLKETCAIHAEAFSSAEVKHGPMTIVSNGFPVLAFSPSGPAEQGFLGLLDDFTRREADCYVVGGKNIPAICLPTVTDIIDELVPIVQTQSFYRFVNSLAIARGLDPDNPPYLNKVTKTK